MCKIELYPFGEEIDDVFGPDKKVSFEPDFDLEKEINRGGRNEGKNKEKTSQGD